MRSRFAAAVVLVPLALAACSSDGTRPTLPSISLPVTTSTVPGSEPTPTEPAATLPDTQPPATQPPATQPPATQPPATQPPATQPPATQPPATQPPATQPPATEPPTTVAPDTTAVETTEVTTTTVAAGDEADKDRSWWPWLLFGVLGLAGLLIARRLRRPSWEEKVTPMLDEVDRLTTHLAALTPDGLRLVAGGDAAQLATARAVLAALVAEAPDERRRTSIDALTAPLADLHLAVGSIALTPGTPPVPGVPPPPPTPGTPSVAQLAAAAHTTSATVRAAIAPPLPPPA